MRSCNLTTLAAVLLAGAVVLVSAAPRRNAQSTWPFGLEEDNTSEDKFQQSPLLDKLLDRIYRRLEARLGSTNNDFTNTQTRTLTDLDQLSFPAGANEMDEPIPARPVKRGKCVGRFVPYMMNC